jgi:hypothetical protein
MFVAVSRAAVNKKPNIRRQNDSKNYFCTVGSERYDVSFAIWNI